MIEIIDELDTKISLKNNTIKFQSMVTNYIDRLIERREIGSSVFCKYIVEKATTPFEKLNTPYLSGQVASEINFNQSYNFWIKTLSSKAEPERLNRFIDFARLSQEDIHQLFAPAKLKEDAILPSWTIVLKELIEHKFEEGDPVLSKDYPIPFEELVIPFISIYRSRLKLMTGTDYYSLKEKGHRKLERVLLQKCSSILSTILLPDFQAFVYKNHSLNTPSKKEDNFFYKTFIKIHRKDRLQTLFSNYPMLARMLCNTVFLFANSIQHFIQRLNRDLEFIVQHFGLAETPGKIEQINMDIADLHNGGESVVILEFESKFKLVYKPRCLKISEAYKNLCQWVNTHLTPKIKVTNVLARTGYGWMEFIENKACTTATEVEQYYHRAGILLGIAYLLGSTDYHAENVIASGAYPVLIDHETLLQPIFKYDPSKLSAEEKKNRAIHSSSVLKSLLLPISSKAAGVPSDVIAGFGSSTNQCTLPFQATRIVMINKDGMYKERYIETKTHKSNLPILNGEIQGLTKYSSFLEKGFSKLYALLLREKANLTSKDGVLASFEDLELRFLFRSTQVYSSILNHLSSRKYLCNATLYGLRLELLARAYIGKENKPKFWSIHERERIEMLDGDIPCFSINTSSEILKISEGKTIKDYFKESCTTSIRKKLNGLDEEDLAFQLKLIRDALKGKYNEAN